MYAYSKIDSVAYDKPKYFISFVDDFTDFSVICTTTSKSDVFGYCESMVTAKFGMLISKLTTDQKSQEQKL